MFSDNLRGIIIVKNPKKSWDVVVTYSFSHNKEGTCWYDQAHRFRHVAMATEFEIFIIHPDSFYAQQAAAEAFTEVDRLEKQLSRYIENSDISRINQDNIGQPIRVGMDAFACLEECLEICHETGGAFDINVGGVKNQENTSKTEKYNYISVYERLGLNEENYSVQILKPPVDLDLGGYGKGYALDQIAVLLHEWDIDCALIHAGKSTALALDAVDESPGWPLTISDPLTDKILKKINLKRQAISGSGLRKGNHIIDPRSGKRTNLWRSAWALADRAGKADALSTAFMVMNKDEINRFGAAHPKILALVLDEQGEDQAGHLMTF